MPSFYCSVSTLKTFVYLTEFVEFIILLNYDILNVNELSITK